MRTTKFLSGKIYGYFGGLLAQAESGTGLFYVFELPHLLYPNITSQVMVAGCYFLTNDRRHAIHPFSHQIIGLKANIMIYIPR
jgi:hypothetical protein